MDIQSRKDSILKGFVGNDLEKGKALPIGTIKKRGPNNFIKTANGWKYHSRANASNKQPEQKQPEGEHLGSGVHLKVGHPVQNKLYPIAEHTKTDLTYYFNPKSGEFFTIWYGPGSSRIPTKATPEQTMKKIQAGGWVNKSRTFWNQFFEEAPKSKKSDKPKAHKQQGKKSYEDKAKLLSIYNAALFGAIGSKKQVDAAHELIRIANEKNSDQANKERRGTVGKIETVGAAIDELGLTRDMLKEKDVEVKVPKFGTFTVERHGDNQVSIQKKGRSGWSNVYSKIHINHSDKMNTKEVLIKYFSVTNKKLAEALKGL